jgi:hypothetical protein
MPRLISTRSLVSSSPSLITPGLTNIFRPQFVMFSYRKSQCSGSFRLPQQTMSARRRPTSSYPGRAS